MVDGALGSYDRGLWPTVLADEQYVARLRRRFWRKVTRGSGCWAWQGCTDSYGYGLVSVTGQGYRGCVAAHRIAFFLKYGPVDGFVLHRCDNPPCVRLDHLFEGTKKDNTQDCLTKGRLILPPHDSAAHGETHYAAKLSDHDVDVIQERYAAGGVSLSELGAEYGVGHSCIWKVVRGKRRRRKAGVR